MIKNELAYQKAVEKLKQDQNLLIMKKTVLKKWVNSRAN